MGRCVRVSEVPPPRNRVHETVQVILCRLLLVKIIKGKAVILILCGGLLLKI